MAARIVHKLATDCGAEERTRMVDGSMLPSPLQAHSFRDRAKVMAGTQCQPWGYPLAVHQTRLMTPGPRVFCRSCSLGTWPAGAPRGTITVVVVSHCWRRSANRLTSSMTAPSRSRPNSSELMRWERSTFPFTRVRAALHVPMLCRAGASGKRHRALAHCLCAPARFGTAVSTTRGR